MGWTLTGSHEEFAARAGELLRADPVRHNLPLTLLETLRASGPAAFGDDAPVYGWHQAGEGAADSAVHGAVDGAFLQTPPFPVLVATLPPGSAAELVATFTAERGPPRAVNVPGPDEATFLAAWSDVTGGTASVGTRSRLFRLGDLTPPDPVPAGAARVATVADRELVLAWLVAFHAEATPESPANAARTADDRLSHGSFTLWEAGGQPVALAGRTPKVAGVARMAPVYTPPEYRRRSYGGAVTTAATQAALDDGAEAVVLFTDQANPTSNALYQRLGYRPVEDRVVLNLQPGPADRRDVTDGPAKLAARCGAER